MLSLCWVMQPRGVCTHSSGNHAQALSMAAKNRGVDAYIVMPKTAPRVKVLGVKDQGAELTFCEPTLAARESTAGEIIDRTGPLWFIHMIIRMLLLVRERLP